MDAQERERNLVPLPRLIPEEIAVRSPRDELRVEDRSPLHRLRSYVYTVADHIQESVG